MNNLLFYKLTKNLVLYFKLLLDKRPKLFYVGIKNNGNFGDILLFDIISEFLENKYCIINVGHKLSEVPWILRKFSLSPSVIILGGGTIIRKGFNNNSTLKTIEFFQRLNRNTKFYCLGAGVGSDDFMSSFGFSNNKRGWIKVLERFEFIGLRGPDSVVTLKDWGASFNTSIIYDPGVSINVCEVYNKKKLRINSKVLGINFCDLDGRIYGNENVFATNIKVLMEKLIQDHFKVVFFSTKYEDKFYIERVLGYDIELVLLDKKEKVECFFKSVDMVLSQRLHGNIFSFSFDVPFLMINYEPKCIDFIKSFNSDYKYVLSTDTFLPELAINYLNEMFLSIFEIGLNFNQNRIKMKNIFSNNLIHLLHD